MRFDRFSMFWDEQPKEEKIWPEGEPPPQWLLDEHYQDLCVRVGVLYQRSGKFHIYTFSDKTVEDHMHLIPRQGVDSPCTRTVAIDENGVVTIISDTQIWFR